MYVKCVILFSASGKKISNRTNARSMPPAPAQDAVACKHHGQQYREGQTISSNQTLLRPEGPNQCVQCNCQVNFCWRYFLILHLNNHDIFHEFSFILHNYRRNKAQKESLQRLLISPIFCLRKYNRNIEIKQESQQFTLFIGRKMLFYNFYKSIVQKLWAPKILLEVCQTRRTGFWRRIIYFKLHMCKAFFLNYSKANLSDLFRQVVPYGSLHTLFAASNLSVEMQ